MADVSEVPYASAVGSLMYAMVCTRPDIAHVVGVVSRYMNNPGKEHWMVVKWILKYLRDTTNQASCFGGSNIALQGYVDADMVGDRDNRRSTTGYVFTVGGIVVNWVSKVQSVVSLSTTKRSMLLLQRLVKKLFCCKGLWMNWVRSRRWVDYTVTTKVPFILQITQHFILSLNVYNSGTNSYG